MRMLLFSLLTFACLCSNVMADLVVCRVPGLEGLAVELEGDVEFLQGQSVRYRHPTVGSLYFSHDDVLEHYKVPTKSTLFDRALRSSRTAEDCMAAAEFALKNAMVDEVYEAAEKAVSLDANHQRANGILELRKLMDQDLGDSAEEEELLRKTVRYDKMQIAKSKHFILLHDTPTELPRDAVRRKIRSEQRLDLLERVYESFLLRFYADGRKLEVPDKRLMVVLFAEEDDFYTFAEEISPTLSSAIGFWDPKSNISFFFDHASSERFEVLSRESQRLQRMKEDIIRTRDKGNGHIVRLADTIAMLVEIEKENSDIEVVSHECTHQMAGNTGLFPRHIMTPSWVHEGLATYFEAPHDASWSGIGTVNESRLDYYQELAENDREHSNIDYIVGDQIFDYARSHGATLHGYAQAWALTHFLLEKHFQEFMDFYGLLAEMPPDVVLTADLLEEVFDDAFESSRESLDSEWHRYMRTLKTDRDKILDGEFGFQ